MQADLPSQGWLFGGPRDPNDANAQPAAHRAPAPPDHRTSAQPRAAVHDDALRALAARIPSRVHLGCSSWSFPGWASLVYDRAHATSRLARDGLAAYAAHPVFRSVGLDKAFYAPLDAHAYAALRNAVAPGFRFLVKAHRALTFPTGDAARTPQAPHSARPSPAPNPLFLDAPYAIDHVVRPAQLGLGPAAGPIVFQFPPMNLRPLGGPDRFLDRLEAFLLTLRTALSREGLGDGASPPLLCVEVRNAELIGPSRVDRYVAALRRADAAHVYVAHPTMPTPRDQAAIIAPESQPALVGRWMLGHGQEYDGARERYAPFDQLVDPDPGVRASYAELCLRAAQRSQDAWVIVNNKAEGSAPLSVRRLAEAIVAETDTNTGGSPPKNDARR